MPRKILIIDDEDDIREVAALSLETVAGWEVIKASSGAQGLARAVDYQPDAILLDVMMPGMDGPSTFRELRKNPDTAGIPVLLLTAKVQSTDQRRFADLGVEAVLFKPFDPLTLAYADIRCAGLELTALCHEDFGSIRNSSRRSNVPGDGPPLGPFPARDSTRALRFSKQRRKRWPRKTSPYRHQEAAKAAAHKLAGVLGTFDLTRGTDLARELEATYSRESVPAAIRQKAGLAAADCAP